MKQSKLKNKELQINTMQNDQTFYGNQKVITNQHKAKEI